MTASNGFKAVIEQYLQHRAEQDELFAATLAKPNKNIDDCITCILNTVRKSGQTGFADEEIFGMAIHYYDQDDIEIGDKSIKATVKVNHLMDAPPKPEPVAKPAQAKPTPTKTPKKKISNQADSNK